MKWKYTFSLYTFVIDLFEPCVYLSKHDKKKDKVGK